MFSPILNAGMGQILSLPLDKNRKPPQNQWLVTLSLKAQSQSSNKNIYSQEIIKLQI